MIEVITKEVEVGESYLGTVTKIMTFGAFIEVLQGKEGLLHISKLAKTRVEKVEDVCKARRQNFSKSGRNRQSRKN